MGEGSGRGSGRVGSDFIGNRGSGQRFAGSGRVQEKWPVDNSEINTTNTVHRYAMFYAILFSKIMISCAV